MPTIATGITTGSCKTNVVYALLHYAFLICLAILEQIKQRKLDVFLEVEEKVMSKNALDRSVLDIITDTECGTPEDKLRLFLVYYICSPNMTDVPLLATTFKSLKY